MSSVNFLTFFVAKFFSESFNVRQFTAFFYFYDETQMSLQACLTFYMLLLEKTRLKYSFTKVYFLYVHLTDMEDPYHTITYGSTALLITQFVKV